MFSVVLHVKISSLCFSFVGDPQDDLSWPVQIREKIGKQSLESASNGCDTHYRECLSSCRTICFKIQMNVFCSSMQMCVSSQNHSYLFVCLQCWGQQCYFFFCILIVILLAFRSISVPDVTRASSRRLQKTPGELVNSCTSSFIVSYGML